MDGRITGALAGSRGVMKFEADVRLLRWSDSSTAGRTATFEFPLTEDKAHPFWGLPVGPKNGQRCRISFELIGDDDQPIPDPAAVVGSRPVPTPAQAPQATASEPGAKNLAKSWVAKEAYRNKSPGEKAVVLASLLIKDAEFQLWAGAQDERHADHMLKVWCGITSKSELADNEAAQTKLNAMRLEFEMAMGRIAEVR
jgi:hypothetical protein